MAVVHGSLTAYTRSNNWANGNILQVNMVVSEFESLIQVVQLLSGSVEMQTCITSVCVGEIVGFRGCYF